MRKLASIQLISDVSNIDGADKIELATILGWQCIVKKGDFKKQDKAVYFEIDSFLPLDERFEFLRKSCYKNHNTLGEGFRIRTIKLRGTLSQGLLMPLDLFSEITHASIDTDVSEILNIKKWELPEIEDLDKSMLGILGRMPFDIPKTDETRIQSILKILDKFNNLPYYITTKLDGTSCTIYCNNGLIGVCGRNYEYENTETSIMWNYVRKTKLAEKLIKYNKNIALQGEFCGPKIQGNKLNLSEYEFFLFDVFDIDKSTRLDLNDILDTAKQLDIKTVPIEQLGDSFNYTFDELLKLADGFYISSSRKEGIVVRTQKNIVDKYLDTRLSFKVINNNFLLEEK